MLRGLTVTLVATAATKTPMLIDPSRGSVAPKLPPLGRFIRREEVVAAVTGRQPVICGDGPP
ncbi:hypothetical protein [Methylobacterium frigidaeris]|uniref:Uncharacterized protein n=1 Tax=Methylobacterium frigidaeris TaxID=2038277 RepID=A0AA37H577_9HYPH|nr:hypothetical protein [Methylobacterium frigidaeris]GJD59913.1 hypothetical protein MPEAHAMD_0044 [Methylobacterium frigidaeris]